MRFLLHKPPGHKAKKFGRDAGSFTFRHDIDPLQFTCAGMTASEMTCDKAYEGIAFQRYKMTRGSRA